MRAAKRSMQPGCARETRVSVAARLGRSLISLALNADYGYYCCADFP
jgi:hypothetical protein